MSIQEIAQGIKNTGEDALHRWGTIAIVFLVALASFGLGRLSSLENARPLVSIGAAARESEPRGMYVGALFVAANKGSVYYYPWCAGASNIAPQNQVWFSSEESAQRAGYTPAKNCKGLGTVNSQ